MAPGILAVRESMVGDREGASLPPAFLSERYHKGLTGSTPAVILLLCGLLLNEDIKAALGQVRVV